MVGDHFFWELIMTCPLFLQHNPLAQQALPRLVLFSVSCHQQSQLSAFILQLSRQLRLAFHLGCCEGWLQSQCDEHVGQHRKEWGLSSCGEGRLGLSVHCEMHEC